MKKKGTQKELQELPSVDEVLQALRKKSIHDLPAETTTDCVRETLAHHRKTILENQDTSEIDMSPEKIANEALVRLQQILTPKLRKVVNASGVVLHTNLGRAPLGTDILKRATEVAAGYSNLEFDLENGKRGQRDSAIEQLVRRLTGAESAGAVNNNAGAVLLGLAAMASNKQVMVSRSEAVEIGGGFRVPDVLRQSGAQLVEVGTTNRTYVRDYENANKN